MGNVLDPAALAALRRLHEAAGVADWGVDYGRHLTADGAGVAMASDPRVVELAALALNALPALLAIAERAAALDPALLARLEARYAADPEPGGCEKCGAPLLRAYYGDTLPVNEAVRWDCPNHHTGCARYQETGDGDARALVRWARDLAGGTVAGGEGAE